MCIKRYIFACMTKALDVRKDFLQMSLTKYVGKTLLTPFRQARMG